MKKIITTILLILLTISGWAAHAQSDGVTVPDLTELNVPLAVSRLNDAGLLQGSEQARRWRAEDGIQPGRIVEQTPAPGSVVVPGTAVSYTVLRDVNAALVYDDNDLTLVNLGALPLDLSNVSFASLDGAAAGFNATRWTNILQPGNCVQVWSIGRTGPKSIEGCARMQFWLTTNNPQEHFWTGQGGTTSFAISQGESVRALCPVTSAGRCDLYLNEMGAAGEQTSFVYFEYTPDWLVIQNVTSEQWMTLEGFTIFNNAVPQRGLGVSVSDASLYTYRNPVAQVGRLAPGQCLVFTSSAMAETTLALPDCSVVGQLTIDSNLRFWSADFEMSSLTDGRRRSCPSAQIDVVTICIMPR